MRLFAGFALFSAVTASRRFRREEKEETGERGYYQAPAYQPAYPEVGGGYVNVHDNHADPSYTNTAFVPAGLNTHYSEQVHHMQTAGGYQQANGYSDSGYVANGETFGDVGEVNVYTPGSTYKEGTSAYNGQALDVQAASVVSNPLDNMVDQANGAYSSNGYNNGYNNNYNNGYNNNSPSYSSGYNSAPEPYAEPTYGGYESERGKGKPSKNDKKREKEMKKNKKKADKEGKKNKKHQDKESKKSQKHKDKGGKKAEKENKKNKKKAAKKAKKNSKQIARSMGMRPGTFNREAFLAAHSQ